MKQFLRSTRALICILTLSLLWNVSKAQYCSPSYFQGCAFGNEINDFHITGVLSTAINDVGTGCSTTSGGIGGGYDDRTVESVTLNQGAVYVISVSDGMPIISGPDGFQVWIDFNNNFTFEASESVGGGLLPVTGALTNINITIPAGAALGSHRMRAAANAAETYPSVSPCPTLLANTHGEVHDYTVVIAATGPVCPPVTGLTASSITSCGATINWTAATGATGYQWAVTTSATPPASGTPVTLTTASATGLSASTNYYAHVRTNCGTGFSSWVTTPMFTTLSCAVVTGLAATSITSSSATINWAAVACATGYEWAVTTSATPPASGTSTTLTTASPTGLTASTNYYAHVRTACGSGFSGWATVPFTTLSPGACPPVTSVTVSMITATSANLSWPAATGATGYEWSVTTSATPPASGTATTLTNANATSLTASTAYYAHVRTICSSGPSAWTSQPFTTLGSTSACAAITGLAASAITGTSATVSWTAVSAGSLGYQYVIDNTVLAPSGSGTNTSATTTSPTGLTAGTTYYAHVRDSCGVGNFSAWNTIPFTTLSTVCNAPLGLTASAITWNSFKISWTNAAGAVAARYVINTNPADPTISGTATTALFVNSTGMTPSTLYYAHVRDSCGANALSAWVTIPIMTTPVSVTNTIATEFDVKAFPNPAKEQVTIKIDGAIGNNAEVLLTDIAGKVIYTTSVINSMFSIDIASLPSGIYLVRYTDVAHRQTIKISKQ
jgi:hypothetical protein